MVRRRRLRAASVDVDVPPCYRHARYTLASCPDCIAHARSVRAALPAPRDSTEQDSRRVTAV